MHAASRINIQNMNARALPVIVGPNMATGNRSAVMATRNRDIPSTPSPQEIPNSPSHE